jgi:hypothetical protein
MTENRNEKALDALLANYRAACPEQDTSANFMPSLWAKIEERRRRDTWLFRWANAFAASAAMLAILSGAYYYSNPKPVPQRAYIEKLTEEINEDHFLATTYTAKFPGGQYSVQYVDSSLVDSSSVNEER